MIPVSFQFLHEPHTEEEVVCLFMLLLDELFDQHGKRLDQPVVLEKVHMAFPDCIIRSGGKRIRIEFEHFGSDFKHDQNACDMVVCWIDDCGGWREGIKVVELSKVLGDRAKDWFLTVDNPYPDPWTEEAFFTVAESYLQVAGTSETGARDLEVARKVVQIAKACGLVIDWPKSKRPIFHVRGKRQFFTVRADGEFRLSLRGVPDELKTELFERLTKAAPRIDLGHGKNAKRNGGPLSVVLDSDQRQAEFFDVWKWLNSVL